MTAHTLRDATALVAAVRARFPDTRAVVRSPEQLVPLDRRANGTVIAKVVGTGSATPAIYQLRRGEHVLAEARSYCQLIRLIMLGRL